MRHQLKSVLRVLDIVNTLAHANFGTNVTRTLRSIHGAVILFNSFCGVQTQSLSYYY